MRIGILSHYAPEHLMNASCLAKSLHMDGGHEVTIISLLGNPANTEKTTAPKTTRRRVTLCSIGGKDPRQMQKMEEGFAAIKSKKSFNKGIQVWQTHMELFSQVSTLLEKELPSAIQANALDFLLIDEMYVQASSFAEACRVPFGIICASLPELVLSDPLQPPPLVMKWQPEQRETLWKQNMSECYLVLETDAKTATEGLMVAGIPLVALPASAKISKGENDAAVEGILSCIVKPSAPPEAGAEAGSTGGVFQIQTRQAVPAVHSVQRDFHCSEEASGNWGSRLHQTMLRGINMPLQSWTTFSFAQ